MANLIYVLINSNKQGLISSGCGTHPSIGNSNYLEYRVGILQRGHQRLLFMVI